MRLKRGTPSGDRAAEKWHATMLERLGSEEAIREHYRTIGRRGGQRSHNGGFASDKVGKDGLTGRERSHIAGRLGGQRSSRRGIKNGSGKRHQKEDDFIESILES